MLLLRGAQVMCILRRWRREYSHQFRQCLIVENRSRSGFAWHDGLRSARTKVFRVVALGIFRANLFRTRESLCRLAFIAQSLPLARCRCCGFSRAGARGPGQFFDREPVEITIHVGHRELERIRMGRDQRVEHLRSISISTEVSSSRRILFACRHRLQFLDRLGGECFEQPGPAVLDATLVRAQRFFCGFCRCGFSRCGSQMCGIHGGGNPGSFGCRFGQGIHDQML